MGRLCLVSLKSFLIGASSGSGDGPVELIARSVSVRTTLIPEAKRANEQAVFQLGSAPTDLRLREFGISPHYRNAAIE